MRKIKVLIGMEVEVGDLAYLELLDIYKRCMNIDGNLELPDEVAEYYLQNGTLNESSYIPSEVFE